MNGFLTLLINISPCLIAFAATFILLMFLPFGKALLGADRGRKFAIGSEVNVGKPTGVGFYFVIVFAGVVIGFCYNDLAIVSSMALVLIAMITGFLDDRAKTPWNEYVKGGLDFLVALAGAYIATFMMSGEVIIGVTGTAVTIPKAVYFILAVILIGVSINSTNATDGVDGLSGSLTVITILAFHALSILRGTITTQSFIICEAVIGALFAYLIFNHYPSKMLMGDAGSRALGLLIALYAMYVKMPFVYLVFGLPFIIDGGLSILKITIGRLTRRKIIIMKWLTTPVHDHLKKNKGFSVPKTMLTIFFFGLVLDIVFILIAFLVNKG